MPFGSLLRSWRQRRTVAPAAAPAPRLRTRELTREVVRKVRRIEIRTTRLVSEGMAGEYHTMFKGRGMEFSEVREYLPGDDVRTIDWNVTSRTGALHIKKYVEERDLTVVVAIDLSGSQEFGSRFAIKRDLAAELAAVLGFAAARNNDRVGAMLFTDRVEHYMPPGKGREHVLRIVREALYREMRSPATSIGTALAALHLMLRRRSVVFVISDFLDRAYERELRMLARRHDVVAIRLVDQRERELPAVGLVRVADAETGESLVADLGDRRFREEYARRGSEREAAWLSAFRRMGVDALVVDGSERYELALARFFRQRRRRRP